MIGSMMNLSEYATAVEEMVLSSWRYRLGRDFESLLRDVTGVSVTWADTPDGWRLSFSLRRVNAWHRARVIVPPGEGDDYVDTAMRLISEAVRRAFPEVAESEDIRRVAEGVDIDV